MIVKIDFPNVFRTAHIILLSNTEEYSLVPMPMIITQTQCQEGPEDEDNFKQEIMEEEGFTNINDEEEEVHKVVPKKQLKKSPAKLVQLTLLGKVAVDKIRVVKVRNHMRKTKSIMKKEKKIEGSSYRINDPMYASTRQLIGQLQFDDLMETRRRMLSK